MAHSEPVYLTSSSNASQYVGAAIVGIWNFTSRSAGTIANVAKSVYEKQQYKNTLPLVNAVSSRMCRVLPRLLKPYPFSAVISIVDFMVNEMIKQTQFIEHIKPHEIEYFMQSKVYDDAYDNFRRGFLNKFDEWNAQIALDLTKTTSNFETDLLESLRELFVKLEEEDFEIRINPVLKPYFDRAFLLSRTTIVSQELIGESQIALGKLIIDSEKRNYKDYLLHLVEIAIKAIAESDWATRYLGRGRSEYGLDRLYNRTTDSSRMIAVYTVVLELTKPLFKKIDKPVRIENLLKARELIKPKFEDIDLDIDPVLHVTIDILDKINCRPEERQRREHLITYVEELADDLMSDNGILGLPIFQLCSKTQTTDTVSLFDETYKMSLKYISPT